MQNTEKWEYFYTERQENSLEALLYSTEVQDESFLLPLLNDASILRLLNIVRELRVLQALTLHEDQSHGYAYGGGRGARGQYIRKESVTMSMEKRGRRDLTIIRGGARGVVSIRYTPT